MTTKKVGFFFNPLLTLSKWITGLLSIPIIALVILIVYFNFNKENITKDIVNIINSKIQGEFSFKEVNISPLAQFPHVSISLEEVLYVDNNIILMDTIRSNILNMENIHFAFDVISLFTNNIRIYGVEIENGNIEFVRYTDSTLNILNAIKVVDNQHEEIETHKDSSRASTTDINISLDYIILHNIDVKFKDLLSQSTNSLHIDEIYSSYESTKDSITFQIKSELLLKEIPIIDFVELRNNKLSILANLKLSLADSILQLHKADIKFDKSRFKSSGIIDLSQKSQLDLNFSVYDDDLSIINLFLSQKGMENIEKGSVYFNGNVTHYFENSIPSVNCKFGFKDIRIIDPTSDNYIENLNLVGSFSTKNNSNLSDAYLIIDTIYAKIPNGNLNASLQVENFVRPKFSTNIDILVNIEGMDKMLGTTVIVDAMGKISLQASLQGTKTSDTSWFIPNENQINLNLDNISCNIPNLLELKKVDGNIYGNINNINLNNLAIEAGNSDFNIDGEINNITQLIQGGEKIPEARLKIKSRKYDLPESMEWIPTVGSGFRDQFPYSIINIDLEAMATITRDAILNSSIMPEMHIDVPYCYAQLDEFLPPVKVSNGFLHFNEVGSGYSIDINGFDIEFDEGNLHGGCTYYDKRNEYDSLDIVAEINSLDPDYILNYYSNDTSSVLDSLDIAGNFIVQMNFSGFDTVREKTFAHIDIQNMELRKPNDTIICDKINIDIGEVYYNYEAVNGPLSVLSANTIMGIYNLEASNIDLEELLTEISVKHGEFNVNVINSSSLLQTGQGNFVIAPFVEIPYFQLDYSLNNFQFDNLFERLNQPPVIKGEIGASLSISGKGKGWGQLSESLNGYVNFEGEHLKLMGLNLDKVIRKLNRTQNFSLVDIGAVIVAGPAGLLITKGADISNLLINKKNDSTEIIKLVSDWKINSGILELNDVAFSTPKNRVAVKGKYSFPTDSIGIVIAVVDKKGEIELHQTISGTSKSPSLGDIKPLKTLLKPVGNLFDDVFFIKGKTFYDGKVPPPTK